MNKEGWLATLKYWMECGIAFRSGDQLEFPTFPSHTVIGSEMTMFQPSQASALPGREKPSVGGVASAWPSVTTRTQPQAENARLSALERPPVLWQERLAPPSPPPSRQPSSGSATAFRSEEGERGTSRNLTPTASSSQPATLLMPVVPSVERPALFAKMAGEVASCEKCVLAKTRTKTVFGVGSADAPVVFVGEGPGAEEDLQGEPFVGAAGRLLDQMLHSITLQRAQVFIANVVKCRPPGNRNPHMNEISSCQDTLFHQLETIRPKAIFSLGKFALLCLAGYSDAIGRARGKPFSWRGIPIVASYHPAYYLRNPGRKAAAWEDLIRLTKLLEQAKP